MSVPRIFAFNPDLLSPEEIRDGFVARLELLEDAIADLRHDRPQHRLFFGPRGMGKTTLLHRLAVAIDDDPELSRRWTPLTFSEEQYGVTCIGDLWLNCLDAIADRAQRRAAGDAARALDARVDSIGKLEPARRAREAKAELDARRAGRGFVLLIDNLELLVSRLSDDDLWVLREAMTRGNIVLVTASPGQPEATYVYGKPLYEQFRAVHLSGLTDEQTHDLLRVLSERRGTPDVVRILDQEPGRVAALRILSGGNPRALVLVHQILARQGTETALADVEALLDMMTPLYKARFEALAPQQQAIVDGVALAFDPVTAADVAARVRLPVKHVSAVLGRLVDDGTLEARKLGSKTAYLVAERLFNIWYLMRANRRARRSLTWLVRFYETFYGLGSAEGLARTILERARTSPREAELLLACALAMPPSVSKRTSEVRAIEAMIELGRADHDLDLRRDDRDLAPIVDRMKTLREIKAMLADAPPIGGIAAAELVAGLYQHGLSDRLAFAQSWRAERGWTERQRSHLDECARQATANAEARRLATATAAGIVGDCESAATDFASVADETGLALFVAASSWTAAAGSPFIFETLRERDNVAGWVGALIGAAFSGRSDEARYWLRGNQGVHRSLEFATRVLRLSRSAGDESLLAFELTVAALRASLPSGLLPLPARHIGGGVVAGTIAELEADARVYSAIGAVRAAIDDGDGAATIDALSRSENAEALRPVLEAGRAALGDGSLDHLAPEIREPAARLLTFFRLKVEYWDFDPVDTPAKPPPQSKRPAKGIVKTKRPRARSLRGTS